MAEAVSFEEKIEKLRKIVEDLEGGDLPLKESLEKFQEGMSLVKQCYDELETAELKIEIITGKGKDGGVITETKTE